MHQSLCLLVLGIALLGCSRAPAYDGPRRYPLSGNVTFDGDVVDSGTISFLPQSDNVRVSGGPILDGRYSIPEEKGANAGTYRVEIRWERPTGKKIHNPDTGEMLDERTEGLPPKFHSQSELTVEVSDFQTTFDFHLKK